MSLFNHHSIGYHSRHSYFTKSSSFSHLPYKLHVQHFLHAFCTHQPLQNPHIFAIVLHTIFTAGLMFTNKKTFLHLSTHKSCPLLTYFFLNFYLTKSKKIFLDLTLFIYTIAEKQYLYYHYIYSLQTVFAGDYT